MRTTRISMLGIVALALGVVTAGATAQSPVASPGQAASPRLPPASSPSVSFVPTGTICTPTDCLTGDLATGTYSIDQGAFSPARFTFTVPAGWTTWEGFVAKGHDLPRFDVPGWDGNVMLVPLAGERASRPERTDRVCAHRCRARRLPRGTDRTDHPDRPQ